MNAQSIMPPYPWLLTKEVDVASTPAKIRVMQTLGVPYPEGFDKESEQVLLAQAQLYSEELKTAGIEVAPTKQIVALIAYLHRLGKDISLAPPTPPIDLSGEEHSDEHAGKVAEVPPSEAKILYDKNCIVCHGKYGEGNAIGPNLTDKYWLNGGTRDDIVRIIMEGKLEKGMQPWKNALTKEQVDLLTDFVIQLQGTDPHPARDPQGEIVE
jgi:hypothetical protein